MTPSPPKISAETLSRAKRPSLELLVARSEAARAGPPVLFLHGAYAGAWCWAEGWLQTFASAYGHAAAVSLRGHGASEGREAVARASLSDLTDDVAHAIRAMPAPPVVVAHSVGGLLAQRLLGRVKMRGLALVASAPPEGLGLLAPHLWWSAFGARLAHALGAPATVGDKRPKYRPRIDFGPGLAPEQSAAYGALLSKGATVGIAEAFGPQLVAPAFSMGVPTLVLHCLEDRLIDATAAARTALYHGAEFSGLAGAGHFPMLGPASGNGARIVLDWLDRELGAVSPPRAGGAPDGRRACGAGSPRPRALSARADGR